MPVEEAVDSDDPSPLAFLTSARADRLRSAAEQRMKVPRFVEADYEAAVFGFLLGVILLILTPECAFVPVGAAFVVGGIAFFVADKKWLPMAPAFAALAAHAASMLIKALILNRWAANGMDLLVIGIGLAWLILRRGSGSRYTCRSINASAWL